jgi:hypothetical protein
MSTSKIEAYGNNITTVSSRVELGAGAQFWAYVSPQNNTDKNVTKWEVTLRQENGNWTGRITSDQPEKTLQTPALSGTFQVTVMASGPQFSQTQLTSLPDTQPNIGCNANCAAMIGIVATPDGKGANYWTVWDAFCKPGKN